MGKFFSIFFMPLTLFFRLSWKFKLLVFIILIAISGFAYFQYVEMNKGKGIQTELVKRDTVTEIVSESGTISTDGRINIYSPTTGVVQKLLVENGDQVVEGQILFTAKSTSTDEEKAVAYANYRSAEANLQIARNTLRDKEAVASTVLDLVKENDSDETFEQKQARTTAEAARDSAFDGVKSAEAQLDASSISYRATQNSSIKSPISGKISNLAVSLGSNVKPNTTGSEPPALIVDNVSTTEVVLALGESDIPKVKVGQEAEIEVEALNNKKFKGTVSRVDEIGTNIQQIVKYRVYIQVLDADPSLKPGMAVDADIITNKVENVLTVPNSAVKPYQGGKGVRIPGAKKGETEFVAVETGLKGEDRTQIVSGLSEGQTIISALSNSEVERKGPFGF